MTVAWFHGFLTVVFTRLHTGHGRSKPKTETDCHPCESSGYYSHIKRKIRNATTNMNCYTIYLFLLTVAYPIILKKL